MDKSLAKGLTKQFIRKYLELDWSMAGSFSKGISNSSNLYKVHKNILLKFNSPWNHFIHWVEFGSKRKPALGWVRLDFLEGNPNFNFRKEEMLAASIWGFNIALDDFSSFDDNGNPLFLISHHVVQRIFERNSELDWKNFNNTFSQLKISFKYLPIYSILWKLILNLFDNGLNKNLNLLNIPIPSDKGIFFGNINLNALDIRTFIFFDQMSENQKSLNIKMRMILDPFVNSHLPYLFYYNNKYPDYENVIEYSFFSSMLLSQFMPIIKNFGIEILPKGISLKEKKDLLNQINNIVREIEIFIQKNEYDILSDYSEYLKFYNRKKLLSFQRKIKIKIKNNLEHFIKRSKDFEDLSIN